VLALALSVLLGWWLEHPGLQDWGEIQWLRDRSPTPGSW
jgi:hypothetical protein